MTDRSVSLSDNAAKQIAVLREKQGDESLFLRLTVLGGGCSGFQYKFDFDTDVKDDDHVFANGSVKLVTDDISLDILTGSQVDYVTELIGSSFRVTNPNAESGCGCGVSFSLKDDI